MHTKHLHQLELNNEVGRYEALIDAQTLTCRVSRRAALARANCAGALWVARGAAVDGGRAIGADRPFRIERVVARGAKVLQALVAIRTEHVIILDRIAAVSARAILHELPALERHIKILLVAILDRERRTSNAISDETDERDKRDDRPNWPVHSTISCVLDHIDDGKNVEDTNDHTSDRNNRLNS